MERQENSICNIFSHSLIKMCTSALKVKAFTWRSFLALKAGCIQLSGKKANIRGTFVLPLLGYFPKRSKTELYNAFVCTAANWNMKHPLFFTKNVITPSFSEEMYDVLVFTFLMMQKGWEKCNCQVCIEAHTPNTRLSTSKYVDSTTIIQNIRQKEGEL